MSKMNTFWKVSKESGDLLVAHSGKDYWTNVHKNKNEFPMSAEDVAALLNNAFHLGAKAKQSEILSVLGIKYD